MKQKYLFIRDYTQINRDSMLYVVWVGESIEDAAKLQLIKEFSKDCGCYFHRWNRQVDLTVSKINERFFSGSFMSLNRFRRVDMSVSDLYRLIIDWSFEAFEANYVEPRALSHVLSILSPSFFFNYHNRKVIQNARRAKRKYLSELGVSEKVKSTACFTMLILLFLLASFLEGLAMQYGY